MGVSEGSKAVEATRRMVKGCDGCSLRCEVKAPVPMYGRKQARYLFIGEAPGATEDDTGIPFIGGAGKLLRRAVAKNGIHQRDVAYTNVVHCRPPKNRTPRASEVEACRHNLLAEMAVVEATVVVLCGATAFNVFRPDLQISHHHSTPMMIEDGRVAIGMIHPAAALRQKHFEKVIWSVVAQAKMRATKGLMIDWPDTCVLCGDEADEADTMGVFYCHKHRSRMESWRNMGSQMGLLV